MSFFVDSLLLPFSVVDISYLSIWIWFHLGAFFFFFRYVVSVIFFFWQYRVITCVYLIMTTGGPSWSFFSFSSHIFFLIYLIFLISSIMIRFFLLFYLHIIMSIITTFEGEFTYWCHYEYVGLWDQGHLSTYLREKERAAIIYLFIQMTATGREIF